MESVNFDYQPYEDDIIDVGGKGRGKTKRAMWILSMIYQHCNYVVFDFNNAYSQFGKVVHTIDELIDDPNQIQHYIYQGDKSQASFDKFCEKLFDTFSNTVIVWEELHQYVTKQKIHQ